MQMNHALWAAPSDAAGSPATALAADAVHYEVLRLRLAGPGAGILDRPRFRDVAVTSGHGEQRFVAGYSTLSGPADASAPIRLSAHAPAVAEIRENAGEWRLVFAPAEVLERHGDLVILDNGFGFDAAPDAVSEQDGAMIVLLSPDVDVLVISGPAPSRIRGRHELALVGADLLPSY